MLSVRTDPRVKPNCLEVIQTMARLDPPMFVFGGIAEDALLDHELSRPHSDIDVMVLRDELSQRLRQCETLGFNDFEVYYEPIPDRALVLGEHSSGLNLELGSWTQMTTAITSPSSMKLAIFATFICRTNCLHIPST